MKKLFLALALVLAPLTCLAENFLAGESISLSATTASSTAQFTANNSALYPDVLVYNSGNTTAFFGCGGSSVTAALPASGATNATPIAPGAIMVMRKGGATYCAAITSTGTTTVYFTAGIGQ